MSKRSCAAAESAESAVLRMARVNVRFRLPAAYCQHVFKLHFAAEQIQCAANCHIDVVVSQFFEQLQVFKTSHAAGVRHRKSFIFASSSTSSVSTPEAFPSTSTAWIRNSSQYSDR